jgi:hypothetical protein
VIYLLFSWSEFKAMQKKRQGATADALPHALVIFPNSVCSGYSG